MPEFIEKEFKSILNKKKYIDSWFWDRYSINPYNGCLFGCVYCDARSAHYGMPEDFENNIIIKQNAAEMLDLRISRARTLLPDVVGMGGVTDCYQGAEKVFENTRQCLEVLLRHGYPIHLATKSTLVLRDADLLNQIGERSWCSISVTITTLDSELAGFLDNRSPSPQRRLEVVKTLKEAAPNIQVGVLLIPLAPYFSDSEAALTAMVEAVSAAGADYLLFGGGMSLRDKQAAWFLRHLEARYPDIFAKYSELYEFTDVDEYDGRNSPPASYLIPRQKFLLEQCRVHHLNYRIPRYIPTDWRRTNYIIAEKLLNEAYIKQMHGQYWENYYWAGQNIQNLSESIEDVFERGELSTIRNVKGKIESLVVGWVRG